MRKFIKFVMVFVIAISLPLEGFAAVLPACALMSHGNTEISMHMQQMHVQQVNAQSDKNKSQNCNCDCSKMAGKFCGQSVCCASCVTAVFAILYHMPTTLLTANIYLSGPTILGPPLITTSHFRPPIIATA